MAGRPTVYNAKYLSQKYDLDGVIIISISGGGIPGYASYGKDKARCDALEPLAGNILKALEEGFIEIPEVFDR